MIFMCFMFRFSVFPIAVFQRETGVIRLAFRYRAT